MPYGPVALVTSKPEMVTPSASMEIVASENAAPPVNCGADEPVPASDEPGSPRKVTALFTISDSA
jgi:hypothetical protein